VLTVVLPNFNHSRFLPQAFEALLDQVQPIGELIVIDDASSDDSCAVIEQFLARFANARFVRNQTNLGVVRNMNIGLQMASGSAIAFSAADDVTYPWFLERTSALLRAHPSAALASGRTDIIDAQGNRLGALDTPVPFKQPGYIDPHAAARLLMHDEAWFTGNTSLFRRDLLVDIGGFPEELSAFTDGYVSRLLAVTHGACYTPETLGAWRRLDDGLASSTAEDTVNATRLAQSVARRMKESGAPFAPGYPERWTHRYLFGIHRLALAKARQRARSLGLWRYASAVLHEIVGTGWLFARFRAQDALPVLLRRLRAACGLQ
jgi:glycosyltransferase involved in cell wall biosynthesis